MTDIPIITPSTPAPTSEPTQQVSTPEATPAPEPKRYKLKVDGEESEASEEEMTRYAQLGKAKEKRFDESVKRMRDAEGRFASMKDKWHEHLQEQGVDPYEAATNYLAQKIKRDMLSPEQRRLQDLEQENQSFKQQDEERQTQAKAAEFEADKQRYMEEYNQKLPEALSKANLPKTPGAIRRVAMELLRSQQNGYDISIEEAAQIVRDEYMSDIRDLLGNSSDPYSVVPPQVAERLMAAHLAKVKSAPAYSKSPETPSAAPTADERLSPSEYRKLFR